MLTFLFWNMGGDSPKNTPLPKVRARKDRLLGVLLELTKKQNVDVLMTAESPLESAEVLKAINNGNKMPFREPDKDSLCPRIQIYPRFPERFLVRKDESSKYTGRLVELPGARPPFLLYVVHFGSKLYMGEDSQAQAMPGFSTTIRNHEKGLGIDKTVLVGDFNMNPFETGMVSAEGLNAVMTREVASEVGRRYCDAVHPFFYNPMWSHFGDSTHDAHPIGKPTHQPAGTCYFSARESKSFFWNILDQVMIRPSLIQHFRPEDLKIVVGEGTTSLLNQGLRIKLHPNCWRRG